MVMRNLLKINILKCGTIGLQIEAWVSVLLNELLSDSKFIYLLFHYCPVLYCNGFGNKKNRLSDEAVKKNILLFINHILGFDHKDPEPLKFPVTELDTVMNFYQ